MRLIFIIIIFCFFLFNLNSQNSYYKFGFEQDFSIDVININNDTLDFAWWGGLNAVQFGVIDINQNGINDLVIFDRHGNKILPLINENIENEFSYRYAPEYKTNFPDDIKEWLIFYDFNNDGKKDIFTYSIGGIKVYKNISNSTELEFELYSELLNSFQSGGYVNIFLTNVDYPIIDDIDGDGDVDILTFGVLGQFVEWHQNMGVELHDNPDTMDFTRTHKCWGNFLESESSNELSLNINCPWGKSININKKIEHVGSTMLFMDTDGDGLKDLFIGDTDFPNLILLKNGGTPDSAHFVSQELNFPSNTENVNLFSIPLPSFIDINNNGKKEFIVTTFDPSPTLNETKNSIWLYENLGTNDSLNLQFVKNNFIQDQMIEHGTGAYPILQDYNGNGLLDLFIANYGTRDSSYYEYGYLYSNFISSIALYENIGTTDKAVFKLIDEDFANLKSLKLIAIFPAFTDLDGDGDIDMVIGNIEGNILFFENTAGANNPMNMILADSNWLDIDVGKYSTPTFFDITKNNLPDLVIGNRMGKLSYWENTGSINNPSFNHITDNFGNISTADLTHSYYGHSTPCFYRNTEDETFLFLGSNRGWLLYYNNIDNNINGNFNLIDTLFIAENNKKIKIIEGMRVSPAIANINNDNYPDLLVGNFSGGLSLFKGIAPPPDTIGNINKNSININVFPNPFSNYITINYHNTFIESNITIYSIDGRIIENKTFFNNKTINIDTKNLSNGIYFLNIKTIDKNNYSSFKNFKIIKI